MGVWVFFVCFLVDWGGGGLFACFSKNCSGGCWGRGGVVCCLYVMETSLPDYQYGLRACFCIHALDYSRILSCTYVY